MKLAERVKRFECDLIRQALEWTRGDVRQAAAKLETPERSLWNKIKRFGIQPDDFRDGPPPGKYHQARGRWPTAGRQDPVPEAPQAPAD